MAEGAEVIGPEPAVAAELLGGFADGKLRHEGESGRGGKGETSPEGEEAQVEVRDFFFITAAEASDLA
jgi:hypothetical protein